MVTMRLLSLLISTLAFEFVAALDEPPPIPNVFINPPKSNGSYAQNEVFPLGSVQNISWTTGLGNYDMYLWQEDTAGEGTRLYMVACTFTAFALRYKLADMMTSLYRCWSRSE